MKVSFLICSNRAPATLDALFDSIVGQGPLDGCEVVFVDNGIASGGADEVRARLKTLPCETSYLTEPTPGIWAARKTSYENARGEWLFILDDDNRLGEGALAAFFEFAKDHPEVGGICPRILADWEVEPPDWLKLFGRLYCLSYTESGRFGPGIGETVWPPGAAGVLSPPGGGMVIRREVVTAFLASDADIPGGLRVSRLGGEDHAVYSLTGGLGLSTAYVPSILVYHYLPRGREEIRYLARLNLRMAYAYGLLAHRARLGAFDVLRISTGFAVSNLASPPYHPWAMLLKSIRAAGYAAGLIKGMAGGK